MSGFTFRMSLGCEGHPLGFLTRREVELQIDALIAALDTFDGDADLEPAGDDEPSLGWTKTYYLGRADDVEGEYA